MALILDLRQCVVRTDLLSETKGTFYKFCFAVGFHHKLDTLFYQLVPDGANPNGPHFSVALGNVNALDIVHLLFEKPFPDNLC